MKRTLHPLAAILTALLTTLLATPARPAVQDQTLPLSFTLGFESVRLPAGERMGLVGGNLLFGSGDGWWLGPGVYGAASGQRGGLFVGGVELQHRWRLGRAQFTAGLFAGGGGGAAAPVGGGLMLRPALAWLHDLGPLQAGLSLSEVRFPSGAIASRHLGLVAAWDGSFRFASAERVGQASSDGGRSGVGVDRLLGTVTSYSLRGNGVNARRIGLAGARLDHELGGGSYASMEAAGAASGGAAGYMEILGSLGWDTAVSRGGALRLGGRVALGLGGGGGVPTGGGPLAKVALHASLSLSPRWRTGIEVGQLRALDSSLKAPVLQWWAAMPLEPVSDLGGGRSATLARVEWTAALQHYAHGQRRDGSSRSLDTIGLKLAVFADDHLYVTGQAHSAFAGGAGAYSTGLVGAGVASSARERPWRVGAEWLVGAAGGGGVASGGGAVVQGLGWAAFRIGRDVELRVGAGAVRSKASGLSTPIGEISISRAFGQAMP